jgi:MoxR-like ATPase
MEAEEKRKDLEIPFNVARRLERRLKRAVKGRNDVIELLLVGLLADGHVLLEDYPGSGKTALAKALGDAILDDLDSDDIPGFRRIQFTPDLLPSDITGVNVFDIDTNKFQFRRGPIFAYLVLGDEINRTSPKVQAAMLEAMAEKQVTVDNVSYPLNEFFFVVATQNPRDLAGTYPLPIAQLDRFLFKIRMDYIDRESEIDVLATRQLRMEPPSEGEFPKVKRGEVIEARRIIENSVYVSPHIHACLVDIARSIRAHPSVLQGVSTRSLVLMLPALKAAAVMKGRDFISTEDIQWLAPFVFVHRLETAPGLDNAAQIVEECMKTPVENLSRATLHS